MIKIKTNIANAETMSSVTEVITDFKIHNLTGAKSYDKKLLNKKEPNHF